MDATAQMKLYFSKNFIIAFCLAVLWAAFSSDACAQACYGQKSCNNNEECGDPANCCVIGFCVPELTGMCCHTSYRLTGTCTEKGVTYTCENGKPIPVSTPKPGGGCLKDLDCDDKNECTYDSCDDDLCIHDALLNTNDPCTVYGQPGGCALGVCQPSRGECQEEKDCGATTSMQCQLRSCAIDSSNPSLGGRCVAIGLFTGPCTKIDGSPGCCLPGTQCGTCTPPTATPLPKTTPVATLTETVRTPTPMVWGTTQTPVAPSTTATVAPNVAGLTPTITGGALPPTAAGTY